MLKTGKGALVSSAQQSCHFGLSTVVHFQLLLPVIEAVSTDHVFVGVESHGFSQEGFRVTPMYILSNLAHFRVEYRNLCKGLFL